jgi:uncharacterized damage-inducible protein DinB
MLTQTIKTLFTRELEKLRKEIASYNDEKKIWVIDKNIANSAGNLCLHLVGNLNTYIGGELGKTGYIRNRQLEFSTKDIPKDELVMKIDETIGVLEKTLDALTDKQLMEEYPTLVLAEKTSTQFLLIHLLAHLDYHLGQVNYHRRLLDTASA